LTLNNNCASFQEAGVSAGAEAVCGSDAVVTGVFTDVARGALSIAGAVASVADEAGVDISETCCVAGAALRSTLLLCVKPR